MLHAVELRCLAGMTEAETAAALGLAVRTVARDWGDWGDWVGWEKARLFLHGQLR